MSNAVIVEPPATPTARTINPAADLRRRREQAAADLAQAQADLEAAADLPARVPTPMGPKLSDLMKAGATLGDLLAAMEGLRKERAAVITAPSPRDSAEIDARRRIGHATGFLRDTADKALSEEIQALKTRITKLEETRLYLSRHVSAADEVDDLAQRLAKWEAVGLGDDDLQFYIKSARRPLSLLEDLHPAKALAALPVGAMNLRKKIESRAVELAASLRRDAISWLKGEVGRRHTRLGDVGAARARLGAIEARLADAQSEIRELKQKQLRP